MVDTNIKEIRDRKDLKLHHITEMTGINKGILSYIERGILLPTQKQVDAIESALGEPIRFWFEVTPR